LVPYDDHFYDTKVIEDARRPRVYFDFLPAEDGGYEAYVLAQGKVTRSRVTPQQNGQESVWIEQRSWEADWAGPFYVAARGGDRYLVTDAGRVFAIPKATPSEFRLKEIWKGKPPVYALIHDADNKKWYAFTKDEYFEITDPVKPRPHTVPVRPAWTADRALETAAKCGRVIRGIPEPAEKKGK
jgi:hypothetical protein